MTDLGTLCRPDQTLPGTDSLSGRPLADCSAAADGSVPAAEGGGRGQGYGPVAYGPAAGGGAGAAGTGRGTVCGRAGRKWAGGRGRGGGVGG